MLCMVQPQVNYCYLLADSWYAPAENRTRVRTLDLLLAKAAAPWL